MTTLSLFQKYELRKNRFAPGTVWVQVFRGHIVKRLQILAPYEYEGVSDIYCLYQRERNVIFRVIDSSDFSFEELSKDTIVSWSEHYMERHYEVVIDE
jgi:hypothetical protein